MAALSRAEQELRSGATPDQASWGNEGRNLTDIITLVGGILVCAFILMAILAPIIARHDPLIGLHNEPFSPPSMEHWFGTDENGRDIFSRVVFAARYDIFIALTAGIIGMCLGTFFGALLGYYGGWLDDIAMRVVDAVQAFPVFILAMGVVAALGQTLWNLIFVIIFVQLAPYIRLVRARVQNLRTTAYVDVARTIGLSGPRILLRHVIPNVASTSLVQGSASTGYAILTVAALSFVGLGVNPPTPEWGNMVNAGMHAVVSGEWWIPVFPGLAIMLAVLGFNLLGDSLQQFLDPRRRRS